MRVRPDGSRIGTPFSDVGATSAEYALMIAGVALSLVVATALLGDSLADKIEVMRAVLFP